jgi:hypothetical protein
MRNPFDPTPDASAVTGADDIVEEASSAPEPAVDILAGDTEPADQEDDEVFEADEVLLGAVEQARSALELITPTETIGEPLGYIVEGEHVLSLLFDCLLAGYPGWRWTVSLSRIDGDSAPQVLETELMPGDDALLAPEWVPWSDRLADSKVAEELAAAGLDDDDDEDDDDDDDHDHDDDDDHDHDDDDDDDSADDGVDAIEVDELLVASDKDDTEATESEAQADDGAPQPPAQAGVVQFSSENDSQHQQH